MEKKKMRWCVCVFVIIALILIVIVSSTVAVNRNKKDALDASYTYSSSRIPMKRSNQLLT